MFKSVISGVGHYVPENTVTNDDHSKLMTTNDEWITERTGIRERRHRKNRIDSEETTSFYGFKASEIALKNANITAKDIDYIVFATLSPDYFFPGSGVLLQEMLGCDTIGALDVRNQCSGFVYAMSVADAFIKSGIYKNVLVVGAEIHSFGLDLSDRGRGVSVIFGDGAGAHGVDGPVSPCAAGHRRHCTGGGRGVARHAAGALAPGPGRGLAHGPPVRLHRDRGRGRPGRRRRVADPPRQRQPQRAAPDDGAGVGAVRRMSPIFTMKGRFA